MLKEEIISKYINCLDDRDLPKEVIFLNSHYIYKPLWAITLEQRNVPVSLLFYSTNMYNIQFRNDEYGLVYGYKKMNWHKFYTFHENHKEFIKNCTSTNVEIEVEREPINLVDSDVMLELPAGPKIALFDVQPFRDSFLALIGRPTNLYKYDISKAMLDDILDWCIKNKTFLVIKPKRDVNKKLCPHYKKMIESLNKEWCIVLDSAYSTKTVSAAVDVIICQPFTSAALSAVALHKPVAYYDVTGTINLDQPACQGVKLLQSKRILYEFLEKALEKNIKFNS